MITYSELEHNYVLAILNYVIIRCVFYLSGIIFQQDMSDSDQPKQITGKINSRVLFSQLKSNKLIIYILRSVT